MGKILHAASKEGHINYFEKSAILDKLLQLKGITVEIYRINIKRTKFLALKSFFRLLPQGSPQRMFSNICTEDLAVFYAGCPS